MLKRNTAVAYFPIGKFFDVQTNLEVTSGSPTGSYSAGLGRGPLTGTIAYDANAKEWGISGLTATELDAEVVGLNFELSGCYPIHYTVLTSAKLISELKDLAATAIVSDGPITTTADGKVSGVAAVDTLTGYVAPDNDSITAIKAKTDALPANPAAVGSPMALADGSIKTTTFDGAAVVPRVALVDTCTENSDMRGTDDAALATTALSNQVWTDVKAGYLDASVNAVRQAVGAVETISQADIQAALTTQGYTVARAGRLDHLDADVSSVSTGGVSADAIALAVRDVSTAVTTEGTLGGDLAAIRTQTTSLATSMIQPDAGTVTSGLAPTATRFSASGESLNPTSGAYTSGEFTMGLYFTSGANAGKSVKITDHTITGGTHIFTVSQLPAPPSAGDAFLVLGLLPA